VSIDQTTPAPARDHIVVGVDGSESSEQALRWAAFHARTTGATLDAVAVWKPLAAYGSVGDWNPVEGLRAVVDETLAKVFGDQRPPGLEIVVREGGAARVLLEASRGARMLVVGSRGHGGFAGLLLGSVSSACAAHATCPVLVVHGATPPPPV